MQGLLAKHRGIIAAHIASNFSNQISVVPAPRNDEFKKGIVDEFKYGSSRSLIEIKKSGKELKAALQNELQRQQTCQATCLAKMEALKEQIDIEPTVPNSYWKTEQYGLTDLPNCYDTYKTRETLKENYTSDEEINKTVSCMYDYNNFCYKYCDCCVQCKMLNTLINNIDDKKQYPLTLDLATMLGF